MRTPFQATARICRAILHSPPGRRAAPGRTVGPARSAQPARPGACPIERCAQGGGGGSGRPLLRAGTRGTATAAAPSAGPLGLTAVVTPAVAAAVVTVAVVPAMVVTVAVVATAPPVAGTQSPTGPVHRAARAAASPGPGASGGASATAEGPVPGAADAGSGSRRPFTGPPRPPTAGSPPGRYWPVAAPAGASRPAVLRGWNPPATPWAAGHRGVDLATSAGAAVRSPAGGRVSFAGPVGGRGVLVVALDGTGSPPLRVTFEPVSATVAEGDRVRAGRRVGTVQRGPYHCDRPCLHWGLLRVHTYRNPLSLLPTRLLRAGHPRLLPFARVPEPRGGGEARSRPRSPAAAPGGSTVLGSGARRGRRCSPTAAVLRGRTAGSAPSRRPPRRTGGVVGLWLRGHGAPASRARPHRRLARPHRRLWRPGSRACSVGAVR